jgi:ABC-type polysaccharide/polyol phosphate transport system ATPase subunit
MSSEIVLSVQGISKAYNIYEKPQDRLKQILFRGRRKYYNDFWALRDVSFEVERGETVGIIGRNGSGKSTLLQIVSGTVTPTTGTVEIRGRISPLLELGSGFNGEFTGRENVFLNAAVLGLSREQTAQRFDEIAAFADIGDFIESPVKHYSSGMFARLAFAVAVHVDPEILIVDEILAVGDAAFQRRCMQKFYEIRDGGCTILFVSHDRYQVNTICQRALYLEQGRQVMFGPARRVVDRYAIDTEEAMVRSQAKLRSAAAAKAALCHEAKQAEKATAEEAGDAAPPTGPDPAAVQALAEPESYFRITSVQLLDATGTPVEIVHCGADLRLAMEFEGVADPLPPLISFVFNLYRHDDTYMCGTTTLMDDIGPHASGRRGRVIVDFPRFPLLAGRYKWRVAINDDRGFVVHAEAKDAAVFEIVDDFRAVGMVDLPRRWTFEIDGAPARRPDAKQAWNA